MGIHLAMDKIAKKGIQLSKKLIDCFSNMKLWQRWPDGFQVPAGLPLCFADQASVSKGLGQDMLHTPSSNWIQ